MASSCAHWPENEGNKVNHKFFELNFIGARMKKVKKWALEGVTVSLTGAAMLDTVGVLVDWLIFRSFRPRARWLTAFNLCVRQPVGRGVHRRH